MEIFGLAPITWTLIICVIGVGLRIYMGIIKNPGTKIDVNVTIFTLITGLIVAVGLVAPVIDAIPADTKDVIILPLIAGQIIIVMKSQSIITAVKELIQTKSKKVKP